MSALDSAAKALRECGPDFSLCTEVLQELMEIGSSTGEKHPLGFFRVDVSEYITDCDPSERFYLHVWRPDARIDSLGLVHTHIFTITSLVLKGCLENVIYRVERNPERTPDSIGEYRVEYTRGGSVMHLGDVQLVAVDRARHVEGRLYGVELGTPHETRVVSYPTVTLIRKLFPALPDSGPLVYSAGVVDSRSSERPRLKISDVGTLLEQKEAERD
ncbi:hypothetical protein [Rhodococcus opacus]|uniref:hypothetical protein n=1 Tax=Rhodococcus opacus TaxID=37919 RepID=UPI001F586F7C|nr:hypothetical protein [Rhodococcus opacus]UNN05264.1 hypothetical protein MOO23_40320 [Rhodococcus opacus]